jgi:hypothetical protein
MRPHYPKKASIMKTLLFAWERGVGASHLMNLRRLAAGLLPHCVQLIAGIGDTAAAAALDRGLCRDPSGSKLARQILNK